MTRNQVKRWMNDMVGYALLTVGVILLVVFFISFFSFVVAVGVCVMALAFVFWLLGGKITVTKDAHTIGYIRWFEYFEVPRPHTGSDK